MTFESDYLTGLLTRRGLNDWYESLDSHAILQLMFIDLDNFKSVNDVYGHSTGDELLKTVGHIFQRCAPNAQIARLGGDEFVIVIAEKSTRKEITRIAEQIIAALERKDGFETIGTMVSASIGILLDEAATSLFDDILFKIDTAMYKAKENGKAGYVVFSDIAEDIFTENHMEQRKEEALENGEFEVHYRPFIVGQTSHLYLSEAVLVWNSPDGLLQPAEFLPIFEKDGFIKELNLMTYEEVCRSIKAHHEATQARLRIGIPTSGRLLADRNFPELLTSLTQTYGVEPGELFISFSESVFKRGVENILVTLDILAKLGFSLIIYDVGSSFSSLRYWDKLSLSAIVIDKYFLKEAFTNPRGNLILRTIFTMGHDLNMRVVADGITEKSEVDTLCALGCNSISGSYYLNPLPLEEYRRQISTYCVDEEQKTEFSFRGNLESTDKKYTGVLSSSEITYAAGISKRLGAVYFPGGSAAQVVFELPKELMATGSYTVSMWLKPEENISWSSALYVRYAGGFCTFCPFVIGGGLAYRISKDNDALHLFHDILGRSVPLAKWSHVCITYDAQSGLGRCFLNGRKIGSMTDVPVLTGCKQILVGGDPFQPCYKGYLSALTFFNCSKTDGEIEELYEHYFNEKGFAAEKEDFWM